MSRARLHDFFKSQINLSLCCSVATCDKPLLLSSFPTKIRYYSLRYVKQERERLGKPWGRQSRKRWFSLQVKLEKRKHQACEGCSEKVPQLKWENSVRESAHLLCFVPFLFATSRERTYLCLGNVGESRSSSGSKSTSLWWPEGER